MSVVSFVAQYRSQNLEDRCNTRPCTDHNEPFDEAWLATDLAMPSTLVLELTNWAFEVYRVAEWNLIKSLGKSTPCSLFGVKVDFDEDL